MSSEDRMKITEVINMRKRSTKKNYRSEDVKKSEVTIPNYTSNITPSEIKQHEKKWNFKIYLLDHHNIK